MTAKNGGNEVFSSLTSETANFDQFNFVSIYINIMVSFNSEAHWLYQYNMEKDSIYSTSLYIWGDKKAGYRLLVTKESMPGFFNADHLWFEFNINLMAKYIYTYHRSMRVYVIEQVAYHVSSVNHLPFKILFGNKSGWVPQILPIRYLTDFKDKENQLEWYRQRSVDEMGEVVQDFINFSDWISNAIPGGRLPLTSELRRHVLQGSFDRELLSPEAPLSSLYLSTLKLTLAKV